MSIEPGDVDGAPVSTTREVAGACPLDCPDTCSWVVTVRDGVAVGLRGDRRHPYTRGALCAKAHRDLDYTRAPDRLLYPQRRAGAKGEGRATSSGRPRAPTKPMGPYRRAQRMLPVWPREYRPGCGQTVSPWGSLPTRMVRTSPLVVSMA
jgi:Molybdopterin oxidoreductase Fe4S4 domain